MYKHILIPTDGSELAEKAVTSGTEFTREAGARVTLFTAVPEYRAPSESEIWGKRMRAIVAPARKHACDAVFMASQLPTLVYR